jgi:HTH-type transcriptional regulator/antitoxin HigA
MYRRGWFEDFVGNVREAEANAKQLLGEIFNIVGVQPIRALHRKHVRSGSTLDQYSLLAWQCRILRLAKNERIKVPFKKAHITKAWMNNLAKLSTKKNSPRLAKEYLKESGIALNIEPHLPQTYLDGAALLLSNGNPVIGMTLRFDRLDNFWFVLFHELAHLVLHIGKNDVEFFDDLEAKPDELEKEADEFACECLIPNAVWETSIARYKPTTETIRDLAEHLNISPAIIAGRIRKESENYLILNDLIGTEEVRKVFTEVKFGV